MEPVDLYVRSANEMNGENEDDVWDDTLLIRAYDKAVNSAKDKIARKLGLPGLAEEKTSGSSSWKDVSKPKAFNKRGEQSKRKWKVGDYCRVAYSVDGVYYEAEIIKLLNDQCLVKYCGYGNEELVEIRHLQASNGATAREEQTVVANNDNHKETSPKSPNLDLGFPGIPPPPPPHLLAQFNSDESEALSAMLMSWYMSGYHTGFYQGLLQSKKDNKKRSTGYTD